MQVGSLDHIGRATRSIRKVIDEFGKPIVDLWRGDYEFPGDSLTRLKHIIAPRLDDMVPIRNVKCGPHALQANPPKDDPAIMPTFSHSAP